jgi:hypothetical protein
VLLHPDHLREVARETSELKKRHSKYRKNRFSKRLELGIDEGKLMEGRKQSIVVDTIGYVICVFVYAANIYNKTNYFPYFYR